MSQARKNVIQQLIRREYGVRSHVYENVNILKNLVCSDSRTFELSWDGHFKQPVYYENQRLYLENYTICYTINGHKLLPQRIYSLGPLPHSQKIQEGLICSSRLIHLLPNKENGPYFLGLSANGWLRRYDIDTGHVAQEIFLCRTTRFKYLAWNEDAKSVVVKSILKSSCDPTEVLTLCVFSAFPLEFVCKFKVHTSTFGKDVNDAVISEGLLCVSHNSGYVRLYSFEYILHEYCDFEASLNTYCEQAGGKCGGYPHGIPLNISRMKNRPPVLFEIKCANYDVKMGGFPWHYMIMPWKDRTLFEVHSLRTGTLAEKGALNCSTLSIRPDRSLFHPDDSGRIIHLTSSELRLFSILTEDGRSSLVPDFIINTAIPKTQKQNSIVKTRSGRTIKQRKSTDMTCSAFDQSLVTFSYEDELDMLVILGSDNFNFENEPITDQVYLYDNKYGKLLKKIQLKPYLVEHLENNITLDCDILINIRKDMNGTQSCYIYRLKEKF